MSNRSLDFLEDWLRKNVTSKDRQGTPIRAFELADACISEAAVEGIFVEELVPEWGSIEAIIYQVMTTDDDGLAELRKKFGESREKGGTNVGND
jgi:hypothetical protein